MAAIKSIQVAKSTTGPIASAISSQRLLALCFIILASAGATNGLKCYMCGQYNEGVGSITPCLNYSDSIAHLYLKECRTATEKYCVKYVSELSTVRDCATECVEKEIWKTQTYCCDQDGCNGSSLLVESKKLLLLLPLLYYAINFFQTALRQRH